MAQQAVLLGWLDAADEDVDEQALALLRRQLAGVIADLPELLRRYLDRLAGAVVEGRIADRARIESVDERERADLEEALRRLARQLRGAPTSRQRNTARGRVEPGPHHAQEHALRRCPIPADHYQPRRRQAQAGCC